MSPLTENTSVGLRQRLHSLKSKQSHKNLCCRGKSLASQQLSQFSAGPIEIIEVDLPITLDAIHIADVLEIDMTSQIDAEDVDFTDY